MNEKVLAGRYRLIEQIGVGGMAIVYRALDMNTGHNVAIKVLKPEFNQDAEFVGRFQREAEAASKMTHHNIVNLLDVGMDGENRYLVMEYVHGKTLKALIQEKGRLNWQVAGQIAIRILSALQHAHSNGIIHRDIKPQNILVDYEGHVKVSDFGIARMANTATLTKGDSVMGTVHYFSPEQASGQDVQATSDLYSVGVVLYEMLTGRVPFDGDTHVAIAMQHLQARPVPIEQLAPDVPLPVIHVCMVAMEKNPAYRYQSAAEMASDLKLAMEGQTDRMQPRVPGTAAGAMLPQEFQPAGGNQPVSKGQETPGDSVRQKKQKRHMHRIRWWLATALCALAVLAALVVGGTTIYNQVMNSATVPDVVGTELASAQRALERQGLNCQSEEIYSSSVAAGLVITQGPEADSPAHKGDTVVLTVSLGPEPLYVPSLVGLSTAEAIPVLQQVGLTLTVVERVVSQDVLPDVIMSQYPEAGAAPEAGSTVQVTVSGGYAVVPDLVGRSMTDAVSALTDAGLTLNASVTYADTQDTSLHNTVSEQSPAAQTQVISGAAVTVTCWRVPEMTHTATVQLELPESDGESSLQIRVTLMEYGVENTVWQGECLPDATRTPELEITTQTAGTFLYKVYVDDQFMYQQQVVTE